MRACILLMFAALSLAQPPADPPVSRVLRFAHLETPLGMQEVAATIRALAETPRAVADTEARILAVSGSGNQLAFAEWLFRYLDTPAAARLSAVVSEEYNVSGVPDSVARIFFLRTASTPRDTQELVNAIRSIGEVQRAVISTASNAMALRGLPQEVTFASWLVTTLDQTYPSPADPPQPPAAYDYRRPGDTNPAVRIFYLNPARTPQDLQELVNTIRSITELQRVVPLNGPRAILFRGYPDQVSAAEWLIRTLEAPQIQTGASLAFRPSNTRDEATELRVFALNQSASPQEIQQLVNRIRSAAGIQRTVPYIARHAISLRGTPAQVAQAARVVEERAR